eukprot:TRINITY_DN10266_c0_g1_i1.p1 TRINITY_DN10266_c0_g1~~TRINITY_DN10266_c0_g1_i1.p1  ORF type:complete len:165 (-),score=37.40 TRINITY_DN10266_c0_g1_i1:629-1123(-)
MDVLDGVSTIHDDVRGKEQRIIATKTNSPSNQHRSESRPESVRMKTFADSSQQSVYSFTEADISEQLPRLPITPPMSSSRTYFTDTNFDTDDDDFILVRSHSNSFTKMSGRSQMQGFQKLQESKQSTKDASDEDDLFDISFQTPSQSIFSRLSHLKTYLCCVPN